MTTTEGKNIQILSEAEATAIVEGPWAQQARKILLDCCFPIFWTKIVNGEEIIENSGTVTVYQTPTMLIGITAAHVLEECMRVIGVEGAQVYFYDTPVKEVLQIDSSNNYEGFEEQDIATFQLDPNIIFSLGKKITPLMSSFRVPSEGCGIMIGGYPAIDRIQSANKEIDFGFFTVLGITSAVTTYQITWKAERDIVPSHLVTLPVNHHLGGISGGPIIGWFENNGFVTYHLCGIVSQSHTELEYIVGKRIDFVTGTGDIRPQSV